MEEKDNVMEEVENKECVTFVNNFTYSDDTHISVIITKPKNKVTEIDEETEYETFSNSLIYPDGTNLNISISKPIKNDDEESNP